MWVDQTFCKTLDLPAYSSSSAQITMLYSPGSANVGRSRYVLDAARGHCVRVYMLRVGVCADLSTARRREGNGGGFTLP